MSLTFPEILNLVRNYDPNQPRDPGGEGGGQWIKAGGHSGHVGVKGKRGGSAPSDPHYAHIVHGMAERGIDIKKRDIIAIESGLRRPPEGFLEVARNAPPLLISDKRVETHGNVYPQTTSQEYMDGRIAVGLRSSDPNERIQARRAKAQQQLGRRDQALRELPAPLTKQQQDEAVARATNPFYGTPDIAPDKPFTEKALRTLVYAVESLDKPGRAVRGTLGGRPREALNLIPFSDFLGITREEQQVSGRDLLQKIGVVGPNVEGLDAGDVGGFFVEMFTDPLFYLGGFGAAAKSAKHTGQITRLGKKAAAQLEKKNAAVLSGVVRSTKNAALKEGKALEVAEELAAAAKLEKLNSLKAAKIKRINAARMRAKPAKGLFTEYKNAFTKGDTLAADAMAAAARKALSTGGAGKNPYAALVILMHTLAKSPIGKDVLKMANKAAERWVGFQSKRIRDLPIPKFLKFGNKQIATGVKRKTTVGKVAKKAHGKVMGSKRARWASTKVKDLARWANRTHATGQTFLESSGIQAVREQERAEKRAATQNTLTYSPENEYLEGEGLCTITANLSGGVRKETWNGRDYFVAPASLIVEGVLNGSKGPLHYPLEEIKNNYRQWEGVPLVVYHPFDNQGRPTRAKGNVEVLNKSIGIVRNPTIRNTKLVAETWFDAEKTKEVDPRVYNALVSGKKIELSTGLDTDNQPASLGASYNGRYYTHIARNYRADHLAILPDQVGACSLQDGCGVLVNQAAGIATPVKTTPLAKRKTPRPPKVASPGLQKPVANEYVVNPFVSEKQRRFMWAKHPEIAKRWTDEAKAQGESSVQPNKKKTTTLNMVTTGRQSDNVIDIRGQGPTAHFDRIPAAAGNNRTIGSTSSAPSAPSPSRSSTGMLPRDVLIASGHLPGTKRRKKKRFAIYNEERPVIALSAVVGNTEVSEKTEHKCHCHDNKGNGITDNFSRTGAAAGLAGAVIGAQHGGFKGALIGGAAGALGGYALDKGAEAIAGRINRRKRKRMPTTMNLLVGIAQTAADGINYGKRIARRTAIGGAKYGLRKTSRKLKKAAGTALGVGGAATSLLTNSPLETINSWSKEKDNIIGGMIGGAAAGAGRGALVGAAGGPAGSLAGTLGGAAIGAATGGVSGYLAPKAVRGVRAYRKSHKLKKALKAATAVQNVAPLVAGALLGGGATVAALGGAKLGKKLYRKARAAEKRSVIRQMNAIATNQEVTDNEWSDEARAAALEARRRNAISRQQNTGHQPKFHEIMAGRNRRLAMQARRGAFLRSPNESEGQFYDSLADYHESRTADTEYHRKETRYHQAVAGEARELADKQSGSLGLKADRSLRGGIVGGVAGVTGGAIAGHIGGRVLGGAIGSAAAKSGAATIGGVAGGTLGGLVGGPFGAAAGAAGGVALGRVVGMVGGKAIGGVAGKIGAKITSKLTSKTAAATAAKAGAKGVGAATQQITGQHIGRQIGSTLGATVGATSGGVLGGVAGAATGAQIGYGSAGKKARKRQEAIAARADDAVRYHESHY